MKNHHVTALEIDLDAIQYNLNYFKAKLQKQTNIIAVVKAFGYGSEAIAVAKSIQDQVSYFAVAYTDEGIALRDAAVKTPIIVLHPHVTNLKLDIEYCLEPNLYNKRILDAFINLAKEKKLSDYPIHLKFNTGLNRLGFKKNDIAYISQELQENKSVKVATILSHLAASEDENERAFTLNQITAFKEIISEFENHLGYIPRRHMTNTSGIINFPQVHFELVRLGIGLYGFGNDKNETSQLKNVISLKSLISQIHTIEVGESVGYNRAFIAQKLTKTATIPIGHADGISRHLGNRIGYVSIHQQKAAIIGNVCMDMIMVDITDIDCTEGDEVVIFDCQETVEDLAKRSNTISYELITAISQRVRRVIKLH